MEPKPKQFPTSSDDRPEGWDYLTPEAMDEMDKHYSKEQNKDK